MSTNHKPNLNKEISKEEFHDIFCRAKTLLHEIEVQYDSYPFEKFLETWKKYQHTLVFSNKEAELGKIVPIIYFHAHQVLRCLEKSGEPDFGKHVYN